MSAARPHLLVGMSVTDVQRRAELLEVCRRRGGTLAFLQQGEPSLGAELTRLADAGATAITVVGVGLGPIGPAHSWLRRMLGHWWRERDEPRPQLLVATRLADALPEIDTVLQQTKPISGTEPGLTSDVWESVPHYRHQVLVCRGPRCTAKGAVDNLRSMVLAMMRHNLADDDVLVVHTGCQFPCNQAPVLSVQPDDVWYGQVDPATAERIVEEHFVAGTPLSDHRLTRG